MECRYCQALNAEDDHRCQRCGRRLRMTPVYTGQSAAAPELQFEVASSPARPEPVVVAEEAAKPRLRMVAYQPMLFSSRELPEAASVEMLAPRKPGIPEAKPSNARPRARKSSSGQQNLEFSSSTANAAVVVHSAEPVIYCDAPVAIAAHRLIAAAYDGAIILAAMTIFLGIFEVSCSFWAGGELVLSKQSLPLFGGIAVVFALLYEVLWALANADTAGMQWARLRLVNFEGRAPDREQRLYRLASGCLSLMAAGLGMLWALVDEEALTWHDHMSKTFPTPY